MKSAWVIATVIITVLVVPSCTGAAGLTAPDMVFSTSGQELASNITLDQAPGGLSGYRITLSLDPTGVAQITRVEFPEWAVFSQTSSLPAETVRLFAGTIQESALPSTGNVVLARIYAVSSTAGTVTPEIVEAQVDDSAGNRLVEVTPVGTVPPVSVSEGGMGSISYTGPEVSGGTTIPTVTTSVTTAPSVTTGGGGGAGSSLSTGTVTTAHTPENVIEAAPSTPTTLPTTIPGPGPVAIVLAGVFAAVLATGWIKRN
jgi:hypothetical protein